MDWHVYASVGYVSGIKVSPSCQLTYITKKAAKLYHGAHQCSDALLWWRVWFCLTLWFGCLYGVSYLQVSQPPTSQPATSASQSQPKWSTSLACLMDGRFRIYWCYRYQYQTVTAHYLNTAIRSMYCVITNTHHIVLVSEPQGWQPYQVVVEWFVWNMSYR